MVLLSVIQIKEEITMVFNGNLAVNIIAIEEVSLKEVHVHVEAYDSLQGRTFKGVVEMINGMPQGHFIHPVKSPLSPQCRKIVRFNVMNAYREHQSKEGLS
jgi:flagellar biosynthesis/type III secretory pathway ATPase